MKRLFLVPVIGLAAIAAATSSYAQSPAWAASSRPSYAAAERQSYYDARRTAYDNGYREGLKEGDKDGRKNEAFRYEDERTFERADKGYHREFGDVERYRQSFRAGYAEGYSDAYGRHRSTYGPRGAYENGRQVPRRNSRGGVYYPSSRTYPGSARGGYGGYMDAAFQNGSNDGYEKGLEDARKNRSFDPLRHTWYRSGDRDYEGRYGSREEYKDIYRRGFQEGYERGYGGGRYR